MVFYIEISGRERNFITRNILQHSIKKNNNKQVPEKSIVVDAYMLSMFIFSQLICVRN